MSNDPNEPPSGFAPLGPAPTPGPSLEEEERAMRKGRWRMIAFAIALGLALLAGLGYLLTSSGPSPYGAIGRQVNGMRAQNFDAFWACALPRANLRELRNNEQLAAAVHERARFNPGQYAQLIRSTCIANLNDHVQPLDSLLPTDDLRAPIEAMRTALASLIENWGAFATYLANLGEGYDADTPEAANLVGAIARGWFEYKVAFAQINDVVRAHVND